MYIRIYNFFDFFDLDESSSKHVNLHYSSQYNIKNLI